MQTNAYRARRPVRTGQYRPPDVLEPEQGSDSRCRACGRPDSQPCADCATGDWLQTLIQAARLGGGKGEDH